MHAFSKSSHVSHSSMFASLYSSSIVRSNACTAWPSPFAFCAVETADDLEQNALHCGSLSRQRCHAETPLPAQQLRPQTPSELDTSQEDNDTWYAEHAQRDPIRHAPVASGRQYDEYVEEYDSKFQDYHQLRQAMGRVQRCCSQVHFLWTHDLSALHCYLGCQACSCFLRDSSSSCVRDLASGNPPHNTLGAIRTGSFAALTGIVEEDMAHCNASTGM